MIASFLEEYVLRRRIDRLTIRDLVSDAAAYTFEIQPLVNFPDTYSDVSFDRWKFHLQLAILAYCYITTIATKPVRRRKYLYSRIVHETCRNVGAEQVDTKLTSAVRFAVETTGRSVEGIFKPFRDGDAPVSSRVFPALEGIDTKTKEFETDSKIAYSVVLWSLLEPIAEKNPREPVDIADWMLETSYLASEFVQMKFFQYLNRFRYFLLGWRLARLRR